MRKAQIFVHDVEAGIMKENDNGTFQFIYHLDYDGEPVSLTMPTITQIYDFDVFPPFFEGLLPEGIQLEALLRKYKIDQDDLFSQLVLVGCDVVGAVTIKEIT